MNFSVFTQILQPVLVHWLVIISFFTSNYYCFFFSLSHQLWRTSSLLDHHHHLLKVRNVVFYLYRLFSCVISCFLCFLYLRDASKGNKMKFSAVNVPPTSGNDCSSSRFYSEFLQILKSQDVLKRPEPLHGEEFQTFKLLFFVLTHVSEKITANHIFTFQPLRGLKDDTLSRRLRRSRTHVWQGSQRHGQTNTEQAELSARSLRPA